MMNTSQYSRIVAIGAWYDLIATIAFATPWTFAIVYQLLGNIAQRFGFDGALPVFEPMHILMVNMFGSVVVLWAILRIRNPQVQFGRYSAAVRVLLITWQLYAVAYGASQILLVFSALLFVFGIAESLPIKKHEISTAPQKANAVGI